MIVVTIRLDDPTYRALRALADNLGTTVEAMLTSDATRKSYHMRDTKAAVIAKLHAEEHTTASIARQTGLTNHEVKAQLYKLGLHANHPFPNRKKAS